MLQRVDGQLFRVTDASDFWSSLHFFLSFLRGLWSGPIIPEGLGRKKVLWSEWSSWRISPWTGVSSWFPRNDLAPVEQCFEGYFRLWQQTLWNQRLRELIHWYVEANMHAGATEGSIILTHSFRTASMDACCRRNTGGSCASVRQYEIGTSYPVFLG